MQRYKPVPKGTRDVVAAATLITAVVLGGAAAATPGAEACTAMQDASVAGYGDLRINATTHADGRCLIEGSFEHRTGVDGVDYFIGFAVALPDNWNQRFLFQGGGGLNGSVRPPEGPAGAGDMPAVERGFAVASTDSGHQGVGWDSSFKVDQIAMLNFANDAVPKVDTLARALVESYYGSAPHHAYWAGCSTGGREGMMMAQRHPLAFDGMIIGAPAMRTDQSNTALSHMASAFNALAATGADGTLDRSTVFSDAQRSLIADGILAACDSNDGVADGMIFDTMSCAFDPATLACGDGAASGDGTCLAPEQVALVETMFAPTVDATGYEVYPAYPVDADVMATPERGIPGLFRFDRENNLQYRNTITDMSVEDAVARGIRSDRQQWMVNTRLWTNLSSFAGNGGRILFYHGTADPWFSALDTVGYYEDLQAEGGAVADAAALYLVPGMGHCRGGSTALDQFDLLTSLVAWVEDGTAPASVEATSAANAGRSRPLCPYPQHAQYSGSGDSEDAANFACVE